MKPLHIVLLLSCLAATGCSMSPSQVIESGPRIVTEHAAGPRQLARCITGNAEALGGPVIVQVREFADDQKRLEIVVRSVGQVSTTLAVGRTEPIAGGTMLALSIWPHISFTTPAEFAAKLRAGC